MGLSEVAEVVISLESAQRDSWDQAASAPDHSHDSWSQAQPHIPKCPHYCTEA